MDRGVVVGAAQVLAFRPGISRSGVTMVAGLLRGLSHEDAGRAAVVEAEPPRSSPPTALRW
jgi:undecaprenyl-diphosphatase